MRRSTINPAKKRCYRYRTRPGFTPLKPNPPFNSERKFGAKTKYLRRKRTTGVLVFVFLSLIRPKNVTTVIERSINPPPFAFDQTIAALQIKQRVSHTIAVLQKALRSCFGHHAYKFPALMVLTFLPFAFSLPGLPFYRSNHLPGLSVLTFSPFYRPCRLIHFANFTIYRA